MTKASGWLKIAVALASGLMVAGLFPPFNFSGLVWVALIPLLAALVSLEGRHAGWQGFGLGFLAGAVSCLIQFNWIATVSWLGAVMLPLYLALFWGAFGAFAATWGQPGDSHRPGRSLQAAFSLGAVWAGLEWLRGWLFTGFSWNALGVGFHENLVLAQGADLLGVSGLSLLLVAFHAVVVFAVRARVCGSQSGRRWDLGVVGLLALALFGYGKFRIAGEAAAESVRLKALLVQINIPQEAARVLWTDLEVHQAYEDETLDALEALKTADGGMTPDWPDWVVWPETALTGRILRTDDGEWGTWQINYDSIAQVREAGPFSLIYGVNELEAEIVPEGLVMKEGGRYYNSIAAMSPTDELQTYRKRHLVIFGETIPFVHTVPFLKKIYEQQSGAQYGGSFTPGDSLEPLPILAGQTAIGAIPTVCFEDSVARLARKFVRPGPQVIVNVTNDGWFKDSPAAAQHFANSRFRTIELRRPMLRAANTGVSAAVDSAGSTAHPETGAPQVLTDADGSHFTRGSLLAELDIPLRPSFSLFVRIGDWGIISLALVALVAGRLRRERPGIPLAMASR
ncbi:MAG: apolipoprotein N-acyltransferase [Akkermansiaceae bacterium]